MGVVLLSKSKKALIFVTDEGEQYVCSSKMVVGLVEGSISYPYVRLARFATPAAPDRFPKSQVLGEAVPDGQRPGDSLTSSNDVYSQQGVKAREQVRSYQDAEVDF